MYTHTKDSPIKDHGQHLYNIRTTWGYIEYILKH